MKLCFLLYSLFSISLAAGPLRYLQTQYYKNDYFLYSRTNYDFKSCEPHAIEDGDFYYVRCEDSLLTPQENLDDFFGDLEAVQLAVAEDRFLENLRNHVTEELTENSRHMNLLKSCLESLDDSEHCVTARENILEMLRRDLPRLRILMAQKNFPGIIYSPTKPQRFRNDIQHSISGVTPETLTENEIEYLQNHTDDLEAAFRQDVFEEKEVPGLEACTIRENEIYQLRDTSECRQLEIRVNYRASLKFNEQNRIYENSYNEMIETNPLLSLLTVTGQESDEVIFADIIKTLDKLIKDSSTVMNNIRNLQGDDRIEMLGYRQAVNSLLATEEGGPSRFRCDLAQKLNDKNDTSELMTDIYIGLGAVAGGGLCAFTGVGLFGCSIGVGLAAEGVALAVAQRRHERSQSAFFAGIGSMERTETNEFSRNLSLYLLPLSMASEGAMQAVRLLRRAPTSSTVANITEEVRLPVQEERRFNFEGRQEIADINRDLGVGRKKRLLDTYNADNKYELNRMDETYFSGLADILEYRLREDFPELSESVIQSRVAKQLDDLIESCKGNR